MSTRYDRFLRRLTRNLGSFQKRRLWQRGFRESVSTDTWTSADIRRYHDRKIVTVVRDAAAHIPFYRELYARSGVDIDAFSGVADLSRLPAISKEDLLKAGEAIVRPGVSALRVCHHTTGGSTGTIATLVSPRGMSDWESGCIYALWKRVGVRKGERMAVLRGALLEEGRQRSRVEGGGSLLTISTYHLRDEGIDEIVRLLDDFSPDWLHVYPSAGALLANILGRTGRRLSCQPRGILCGSEILFDWQITLFERVFGGKVYSHYGHGEMALLGGWCEGRRAFHFLPNHGYLEILDDHQHPITEPGVAGEITGTGFFNDVMPLIRYRTADYGAWDIPGPCAVCGRFHQRLASIDGRIQEYLILADGTRFPVTNINALHGTFFSLIYRYQFLQDGPGKATLRFVPAIQMTENRLAQIRLAFAYLAELGLEIDLSPVSDIALSRRGKQRIVVSSENLA
ncbi:MAG: phenylacetate--CoA ligase family protein [Armatimonadetes bacterium]|nr:phenylacetate--CoA ligase family protein [Armatimonadota bacterium]